MSCGNYKALLRQGSVFEWVWQTVTRDSISKRTNVFRLSPVSRNRSTSSWPRWAGKWSANQRKTNVESYSVMD